MTPKHVKGTEAMLLSLLAEGADTIFGYPGGSIMPLYDELYRYADRIDHILVRHEQGAVHAAEGFARSTGRTGVCLATAGPGATNFVTGIADAMLDSTPLVCITAQVSADKLGTNFFQEADMINITLPITKWSYQITRADEIAEVMARAFHIASSGRPGPVVVSFAKNAQVESVDFEYDRERFLAGFRNETPRPADTDLRRAAEWLSTAERPLILAGQGVTLSGAEKVLRRVAEAGNIPVATTLLGISGIPSDHPLYVGNVGMHGHLAPNRMTQEADLILAVGMRFSDRVTGEPDGYAPKARIIHAEIDPAEVNKTVRADLPLVGDARQTLEGLLRCGIRRRERADWFAFARREAMRERREVTDAEQAPGGEHIRMPQVVDGIARLGGAESIVVTDVGQNQMFGARYSRFRTPRSWITSGGLGTMGFGLPAAVGAKVGNPQRQVVALVGDGGFQMNLQELGTIMQSHIGVKIVLLNNSYLGMVRQWQELFFGRRYSFTRMANPDFPALVAAYGIPARRVVRPDELEAALRELLAADGPAFLEVATEPEENVFPMVPAGAVLDGILTGKQADPEGAL